jgi:hypothetical protein
MASAVSEPDPIVPDLVTQWRQAAEANEELARTEAAKIRMAQIRLAQHVEAAQYCRGMVAKLEQGREGPERPDA